MCLPLHPKFIFNISAMQEKRSTREWLRRCVSFVFSLFILGVGVSLAIRANLGSSPITCPPYVLSMVPSSPLTVGGYIFCMQFFFVLLQFALLRKDFHKIQFLQLGVCLLFGCFTDLGMWLTQSLQWNDTWAGFSMRWIQLALSGIIIGVGVVWEVRSDVLLIPGEGLPVTIAKVFRADFGKIKIGFDVLLVAIAILCSYIFFGRWRWDLVGVGTLFSMFYVGIIVRLVSPHMKWLDNWLTTGSTAAGIHPAGAFHESTSAPLVITISRQYGSGGHEIGERLARELNIPLYDRTIIDQTARELGYSTEYIKRKEQSTSNMELLKMIFADSSGMLPEMELSDDDAIFVTESRIIRRLAAQGPCVIIGRLADFLLKQNPHCFRVFVYSDIESAINRISRKYNLPAPKAEEEINRINKKRANHYWRYTGQRWGDTDNYDLVVNVSRIGIDKTVEIIRSAI